MNRKIIILPAVLLVLVLGTSLRAAYADTSWITFTLSDSSDPYQRVWAVFDCNPGAYKTGGQWTNSGCEICSGNYYSGNTFQTCDNSASADSATYYFYCVSVPDSGYGSYSGSTVYHDDGVENGYPLSGITENHCYQSTNPYKNR